MTLKAPDFIGQRLAGWSPRPEAQMVIFWRIIHMYMARYGSIPLGQMLVELTTIVLNELGRAPTVTDLCDATGLPKSSISRYISAQMAQGLVSEIIDAQDRRRRKLVLTDKGKSERRWQIKQIRKILEDVKLSDDKLVATGGTPSPDDEFARMKKINANPPENVGRKRKPRRRAIAA